MGLGQAGPWPAQENLASSICFGDLYFSTSLAGAHSRGGHAGLRCQLLSIPRAAALEEVLFQEVISIYPLRPDLTPSLAEAHGVIWERQRMRQVVDNTELQRWDGSFTGYRVQEGVQVARARWPGSHRNPGRPDPAAGLPSLYLRACVRVRAYVCMCEHACACMCAHLCAYAPCCCRHFLRTDDNWRSKHQKMKHPRLPQPAPLSCSSTFYIVDSRVRPHRTRCPVSR